MKLLLDVTKASKSTHPGPLSALQIWVGYLGSSDSNICRGNALISLHEPAYTASKGSTSIDSTNLDQKHLWGESYVVAEMYYVVRPSMVVAS